MSRLAVALPAWALVLAAGVALRFWQLGDQVLIDDEWHAIHKLMRSGLGEIFLSFGHADHCIPLTLWFRWLAETVGLSEWRMRAMPVLAGCLSMVVMPMVLKPWLKAPERWLFAALIAVSPLLIHFSRYVRPYAASVLLGFVAVVALWRGWHEGSRAWLGTFIVCAVLAAWLHPLTLLFTGSALLWFGVQALIELRRTGRWSALMRIALIGSITGFAAAALVLPPLLADPSAMLSKSGIDRIEWRTWLWSWELMVGTARPLLLLPVTLLAVTGACVLWRRCRAFLAYWLWLCAVSLIVILALNPAWIQHALVLVRYTAVAQPFVLALIALGAWVAVEWLMSRWPVRRGSSLIAVILTGSIPLLLLIYGPLPEVYRGHNQFTSHMRYHFDFDFEDSIYTRVMAEAPVPQFYARIAAEPGHWMLIETPWHFESHYSPLSEYQRGHQMPLKIGMISGLCTDWTYGELRPDLDLSIRFRHFVFLTDVLAGGADENRFVVFHRGTPFGEVRELPAIEGCIEAFRERFGEPWHEDRQAVIFRLPADPE